MLSMTGYGAASSAFGAGTIVVEARSFNHRFLDIRVRLPGALQDHAAVVDEIARRRLERGRVEVTARIEGGLSSGIALDRARAKAALLQLQQLAAELGIDSQVAFSLLGVVPGLFVEETGPERDALGLAISSACRAACDALVEMRRAEGKALQSDLGSRLQRVRQLTTNIAARTNEWTHAYRDRLRARLDSLLQDKKLVFDPMRLEQEVALLAERSDVSEEITRLAMHCEQFAALLRPGDEPTGRRLEFLLQEMAREANTLGAKSADARMTASMLEIKVELERMREQVQNVL
jgi:uncharacterized protein (TIGR00255 family)